MALERAHAIEIESFEKIFLTYSSALMASEEAREEITADAYWAAERFIGAPEAVDEDMVYYMTDIENEIICTEVHDEGTNDRMIEAMEAFWSVHNPMTGWDRVPLGATMLYMQGLIDDPKNDRDRLVKLYKKLKILDDHIQVLLDVLLSFEEGKACRAVYGKYFGMVKSMQKQIDDRIDALRNAEKQASEQCGETPADVCISLQFLSPTVKAEMYRLTKQAVRQDPSDLEGWEKLLLLEDALGGVTPEAQQGAERAWQGASDEQKAARRRQREYDRSYLEGEMDEIRAKEGELAQMVHFPNRPRVILGLLICAALFLAAIFQPDVLAPIWEDANNGDGYLAIAAAFGTAFVAGVIAGGVGCGIGTAAVAFLGCLVGVEAESLLDNAATPFFCCAMLPCIIRLIRRMRVKFDVGYEAQEKVLKDMARQAKENIESTLQFPGKMRACTAPGTAIHADYEICCRELGELLDEIETCL